MELDQGKIDFLDALVEDYAQELRAGGDENAAVTLSYTHSLHRFFRQVVRMVPVPAGGSLLDVGSGLGILAFELAANAPVSVLGIDLEPGFVEHSRVLQDRLAEAGFFDAGASVDFAVGDIQQLELPDGGFDLAFVREVLQFVPEPERAAAELLRVLRPGAFLCISDMDDALRITWPPPSPLLERLVGAVSDLQHEHGGDRHVGRKLTTYLRGAGFHVNSIVVLPEAQHRVVDSEEAERSLVLEQLHAARERVLAAGAMDIVAYDADLGELEREPPFEEFRMSARIVVLAQRPR
jgi:ubiquinone/menaquinone biosynthesis C-methylase UbiE